MFFKSKSKKVRFSKHKIADKKAELDIREEEVSNLIHSWDQSTSSDYFHEGSHFRALMRVITFILIMFVFGMGVWLWTRQPEFISKLTTFQQPGTQEMKLTLTAPQEITSGEEVEYQLSFSNPSPVVMSEVSLNLTYPPGFIWLSSSPEDPSNLSKNVWKLGSIEPQSSQKLTIKGQLTGQAGVEKEVRAKLWYKPINLHARLQQKKKALTLVKDAALKLVVEAPVNLVADQEVIYKLVYQNQTNQSLKDVRIKAILPPGLSNPSFNPMPEVDTLRVREWQFAQLEPESKGEVLISGLLTGQENELKELRAEIGFWRQGDFRLQNTANHIAAIIQPAVRVKVEAQISPFSKDQNSTAEDQVEGADSEEGSPAEDSKQVEVKYTLTVINESKLPFTGVEYLLQVVEGGDYLNLDSFSFKQGFVPAIRQPESGGLFLSWEDNLNLKNLDLGQERLITFTVLADYPVNQLSEVKSKLLITAQSEDFEAPLKWVSESLTTVLNR